MAVDITFPDGTKKTINKDIMNGDNGFSDCAESSSFPVGATVCKTLALSINNDQEQWKNYNFYGAKIHAYLKLQTSYAAPESVSTLLDESYNPILDSTGDPIIATQAATKDIIETIDKGVYTVTTPEQYSDIINITALDDMYKANKVYTSGLKLPQSLINLVRDACKTVGIGMNLTMDHGDIIIRSIPDSMTFRQLFGYAAMVESANARIDYSGNLQFVKWDFERTNIPKLKNYGNPPTLSSDDIVITGIKVTNGQSNDDTDAKYSAMYGEEGYVLELENELIDTDQLQTVANIIGEQIVGARFRNLEGDLVYNPLVEFGDMVYTYDRLGNKYLTPLTDVSGNVGGLTTVKTQADDPIRGSSDFYGNSTKAIVAARQMVQKETSAREEAIQRLAETLNSSSGLYMTQEPQQDGSIIYYMHNKATIAESNIIWKLTAEAFAVSVDGGKTYPYGFAVTGELITRLLYAEGINADYINAGTLIVRDKSGNAIFEADMDTKSVYLDGSVQIGGGKSLNQTFANYLQESKDYSDGKLSDYAETVTGSLGELQDQIDGQIETFYYDYEPTLQNKPASDWTSAAERKKHIGDLFFNKTTGYAYRFMQDGATWGWTLVQDTDITKAMKAAENAQDTADHKRRVFVTKPQPPYDIGDLWSQSEDEGGDILTCTVSRAKGASYVQSDWQKLNKYTDDTKAEEALETASLARNMTMQLDNDYQGIPVDSNGNYTEFPECTTTATVMYGTQDITNNCTYTITTSQNIQGHWNKENKTYTVTGLTADSGWVNIKAAYLNNLVVSKQFSLAKQYAGKDGANGIPGKDGKDGKTQYTHLAYANSADGKKDFSVSDGNREYIGMYVDFVEADSTDPTKYTWSLIKGADGAQGVPGTPGADGKTPYFHIAYANSADGKTGFSVDDSVNKLYIGQYTDYTPNDSTDPTKYSWTKIKGEQGSAGRTYFFQSNADVLLMGADKKITPAPLIVDSFYRDGNGEIAQTQKGWWKLEKSTDNGATWSALTVSQTAALDRLSINVNNLSLKAHNMLKVSLYFDQAKTKLADYQTFSVAVDVASLTQEQIVDILSDSGNFKGFYYEKDESGNTTLYISFNAAKGGVLALGGQNDGNGLVKIYDSSGSLILTIGQNGIETRATTLTNKNAKGKIAFNKKGLTFTEDIAGGSTGTDEDLHLEKSIISFDSLANIVGELDKLTVRKDAKIEGRLLFYDYENQSKKASGAGAVTRQPVASVTADTNRVAFLMSDYHANGYGVGSEHANHRLGVKAQWGSSSYTMYYIYTNTTTSDIRLKENIKNSETDALETVNQMKVRQFDWKERMGGWHQDIGFVADELEEIDPNLALGGGYDENGEMDIKQINSPYLLNYAIKAIQELSAKVDEQEKRIKELERRLQ
nr:MAG TPA: tail protein [Caudoviricetes sp.]